MRRFLLIALAVILCSAGLFAGYVMWDYDPDNESPLVAAPSYLALFNKAARERAAGTDFDALEAPRKLRVLTELIAQHGNDPVREVALFKARELTDKDAALAMLRKELPNLRDEHFEVAIASIAALGTPKAQTFLDTTYKRLAADPAAHTPIGDYRTSTLTIAREEPDLTLAFEERSRVGADYAFDKTREIGLFFPSDPDYLFAMPNADDVLAAFDDSRFMKTLDGSPVPKDAWSLPMLRTLASLRGRLGETMGFLAPYFSPEKFFRDMVVIGKYKEEYLIASYKDKNVSVAEALVGIFSKLGKDFGIRQWTADGITIASVRNLKSGRTLSYAVVGDYFVVATDTALIGRAAGTFKTDQAHSIAIDPVFAKSFGALDQSGDREIGFLWFNPTTYFGVTGSTVPTARHLAIVARALGRATTTTEGAAQAEALAARVPGVIGWSSFSGDDPTLLWRYVVNVRSLGKNPIDSLARLAKMDIGKQIVPFLSRSLAIAYAGVDHLKQNYGYSNTAFNLVAAVPLHSVPARFDSTLRVFFGRITSLEYTPVIDQGTGVRMWMASDTTTNDSLLRERKLQPSFAIVNNALIVASTPGLLRTSVTALSTPTASAASAYYCQGRISTDAFAENATKYVKGYLSHRDIYTPAEIASRIDPLRAAIGLYDRLEWKLRVENGLRLGAGRLVAKR